MSDTTKTPKGRLREEGVREIRARRMRGETYQQIAQALGVTITTVANILRGRTWKWLA